METRVHPVTQAPCPECKQHITQNGALCGFCVSATLRKGKTDPGHDDLLAKWIAQSLKEFEAMYSGAGAEFEPIEAQIEFHRDLPNRIRQLVPILGKAQHPAAPVCAQFADFIEKLYELSDKAVDEEDAKSEAGLPAAATRRADCRAAWS